MVFATNVESAEIKTFEDIKAGARLRGLAAAGVAEIVQVNRFGPDAPIAAPHPRGISLIFP